MLPQNDTDLRAARHVYTLMNRGETGLRRVSVTPDWLSVMQTVM